MSLFVFLVLLQDVDGVSKHLQSTNYTVTWNAAAKIDPNAELEIGTGSGHGFHLRWLRFRPTTDRVEILAIDLDEPREPYESKWPPDRVPASIKMAEMKPAEYAALLEQLAAVDAAELKPKKRKQDFASSSDFWAHARLAVGEKKLIDLEFAGYDRSSSEMEAAKPKAMRNIALLAIKTLKFKDHVLTKEDRAWASAKFTRDWKQFLEEEFHWWVRERSIRLIGVVGDDSALPALKEAMSRDPKDRCVYYAINAITRLTNKDLREGPVEQMDVEKTRERLFDFLKKKS